ncbi:DUF6502 family protein [Pseudaquabacterium rugosum]|uniref:DUF6502 family protein n=1 Tax=Pseudaquabacterium rugosum TaxID=2984194 RepID=A0ABU9BCW3_9BURK
MSDPTDPPPSPATPAEAAAAAAAPLAAPALAQALRALLQPLAQLALAHGLTHATLDELLRQALVAAADARLEAEGALPAHRRASRITTATGIHRRDVTRLLAQRRDGGEAQAVAQRSQASEVFARWRALPDYCDRRGSPRELPRQGPLPSFETLAQGVTRDVHPRSLLDELLRLGVAAHDTTRDSVRLVREHFVPAGDGDAMLQVLGRNVGTHLQAAVDNVLGAGRPGARRHFEQALFARGLSDEALRELQPLVEGQWQQLIDALVPRLQALVDRDDAAAEADRAAGHAPAARAQWRLGLYAHDRALPPPAPDAPHAPDAPPAPEAGHPPDADAAVPAAPRRAPRRTRRNADDAV